MALHKPQSPQCLQDSFLAAEQAALSSEDCGGYRPTPVCRAARLT